MSKQLRTSLYQKNPGRPFLEERASADAHSAERIGKNGNRDELTTRGKESQNATIQNSMTV